MIPQFILSKIIPTIKKYSMLAGDEKVLVGLSGGPDSVCLLRVLHYLSEMYSLQLSAIYVDHLLRPGETDREIEFCRRFCESLGIPFTFKTAEVKRHAQEHRMNIQEAARTLRYEIFAQLSYEIGAHKIALGHTADDQAETLLMRLLRGTGPTGLGGIPPVRLNIIRPLIETERREIEHFLDEEHLEFVIDSSNMKKDYFRNRVRLSLLPAIAEFNPEIVKTLSKTAAIFRDEERYFEIIVTKTLMKMISRKKERRVELFVAPFEAMHRVIMRRVLRRIIDETSGLRGITFSHIDSIMDLVKTGKAGDRIYLPNDIRVIKDYATLVLTSEPPAQLPPATMTIPGDTVLKESGVVIKASVVDKESEPIWTYGREIFFFDADKITLPLTARRRNNGDFFFPMGFGKRKKIQDFFVDEKIPRDERDRIPLIVSNSDIVCVLGYRGDERFRVTDSTTHVLKLEVKKVRD